MVRTNRLQNQYVTKLTRKETKRGAIVDDDHAWPWPAIVMASMPAQRDRKGSDIADAPWRTTAYIVMAYLVIAYIVMAYMVVPI